MAEKKITDVGFYTGKQNLLESFTKYSALPADTARARFDKEVYYMTKAIAGNNMLKEADPTSLMEALVNVAQFGLSLDPALKLGYLIPRKVNGAVQARFEPSYMGMLQLLTQIGALREMKAVCIYENDAVEIDVAADEQVRNHTPWWLNGCVEAGQFVAVYTVAYLSDGRKSYCIMPANEVYSIRERSDSYKRGSSPWKTDFDEMAKKTCIRRHFKTLPKVDLRPELQDAVHKVITEQEADYRKATDAKELREDPYVVMLPPADFDLKLKAVSEGITTAEDVIEEHKLAPKQAEQLRQAEPKPEEEQ